LYEKCNNNTRHCSLYHDVTREWKKETVVSSDVHTQKILSSRNSCIGLASWVNSFTGTVRLQFVQLSIESLKWISEGDVQGFADFKPNKGFFVESNRVKILIEFKNSEMNLDLMFYQTIDA
jgi:hypothetical protein